MMKVLGAQVEFLSISQLRIRAQAGIYVPGDEGMAVHSVDGVVSASSTMGHCSRKVFWEEMESTYQKGKVSLCTDSPI